MLLKVSKTFTTLLCLKDTAFNYKFWRLLIKTIKSIIFSLLTYCFKKSILLPKEFKILQSLFSISNYDIFSCQNCLKMYINFYFSKNVYSKQFTLHLLACCFERFLLLTNESKSFVLFSKNATLNHEFGFFGRLAKLSFLLPKRLNPFFLFYKDTFRLFWPIWRIRARLILVAKTTLLSTFVHIFLSKDYPHNPSFPIPIMGVHFFLAFLYTIGKTVVLVLVRLFSILQHYLRRHTRAVHTQVVISEIWLCFPSVASKYIELVNIHEDFCVFITKD